jgi:hypothetical protein
MRFPGLVSRGKGPSKRHDGDDAKAAVSVSQAKFILPQGHRLGEAAMSARSYAWLAPVVFAIVVIPAVGARCRGLAGGAEVPVWASWVARAAALLAGLGLQTSRNWVWLARPRRFER